MCCLRWSGWSCVYKSFSRVFVLSSIEAMIRVQIENLNSFKLLNYHWDLSVLLWVFVWFLMTFIIYIQIYKNQITIGRCSMRIRFFSFVWFKHLLVCWLFIFTLMRIMSFAHFRSSNQVFFWFVLLHLLWQAYGQTNGPMQPSSPIFFRAK